MKRLLLTGITAALFSIAAIGQEKQDTTQNQSNQFRQTEEMEQDAEETADSVSTEFQEGVNEVEREADQAEDNIQREGQELRQDAREKGENIEDGAERAGDEIEETAEEAGEDIDQATERAGDEIEQKADEAGDNTNRALNRMDRDPKSDVNSENEASANYNTAPELEVVESKEGPNSEVVYKYQDEYFYVDRNEKKLVKVKESELQNAKHKVMVKDAEETNTDEASNEKGKDNDQ